MTWKCDNVHGGSLRPAASDEEYQLHQAALGWSLADSIVIESIEESQG